MDLTTPELERLLDVTRAQLSRYATAGRLRKVGHGLWDAASVASIHAKCLFWGLAIASPEERQRVRANARARFRRALVHIVVTRNGNARPLDERESEQIREAVAAYGAELYNEVASRDQAWMAAHNRRGKHEIEDQE